VANKSSGFTCFYTLYVCLRKSGLWMCISKRYSNINESTIWSRVSSGARLRESEWCKWCKWIVSTLWGVRYFGEEIKYRRVIYREKWWPHPDLNRGPADYEAQTEPLPIVTLFTC